MALVPLDVARAHVLQRVRGEGKLTEVALADAVGMVAGAPVIASEPVPPFPNSAMDGYALRASDTIRSGSTVRSIGTALAGGGVADEIRPGEAVRIMTGAPMPPGADAVVPVERTTQLPDGVVRINESAAPGDHVREAGEDVSPGDEVLPESATITPAHLGVLASLGVERVVVVRRPRVGVLSTGDELVQGPEPLLPGQIRDSNRRMLLALVSQAGAEPVDLGVVGDDEETITAALLNGVTKCDAVLTSGGVSMGDVDLVRVVLDVLGDMRWMQVAIKPAKPFAFGLVDAVPVFGLPGNPVSSLVSFELFARPAIRRLSGHPDGRLDRPCPSAIAVDGLPRRPDGKIHFVRVRARLNRHGILEARSVGGQASHHLAAAAAANGLAVLLDGEGVEPGGKVDVLLIGEL